MDENINKYELKLEDSFGLIISGVRNLHYGRKNDRFNDFIDFGGQVVLLTAMLATAGAFSLLRHTIKFFNDGLGYGFIVIAFAVLMLAFAYGIAVFEDKYSKHESTNDKEFANEMLKRLNLNTNADGDNSLIALNVETMLRYPQLNNLEKQVKQLVDKHVNIGVVSRGLEKLRKLGNQKSDDYKELIDIYAKEVKGLEDDLFVLVLPKLTNEVNRLVARGDFDLLPKKVTEKLADSYEKEVLGRIEADNE